MKCRFGIGSITQAQQAQAVLVKTGISSRIIKLEISKNARGCAYGIEVEEIDRAYTARALKRAGIKFTDK